IICETIKGKGVSFMENEVSWHGTAPSKEQCDKALKEIGGAL
ncbi:MAG: transketolase, partial [Clostridiaceae bacterium]|nr:transketolase [Clostridiaceae bacterium]